MSPRLALAAVIAACGVSSAQAQVTLVCQTPNFWCSILAPGYFNGASCWCGSPMGPIPGYTIIPAFAPQFPGPQQTFPDPNDGPAADDPPPVDDEDVVVLDDPTAQEEDCLNGLGNCAGAFGE